jgi:8-oxo-dGTP pyrophosphatase MutT (NUDIX family)
VSPEPVARPRPAATVLLLRSPFEVYLVRRAATMVFAGGMYAFPGGTVDPRDAATDLDWVAPPERLGLPAAEARAVVCAAVREVFEETGVLLAVPVADLSGARSDVEAGRVAFGALLRTNSLRIDAAVVQPWSRWVTPRGEVRRYDTRFFVAALPADAQAQDVTTESSSAGWFGVGAALEAAQRGELGMLPPTIMTLASLASHESVASVLAAAASRSLEAVRPIVEKTPDGGYLANLPDGTSFALPRSLFPA